MTLDREPTVIVSSVTVWLRNAILVLLGIVIALTLLSINLQQNLITELNKNRAVDCRIVLAEGLELLEDGPCRDPAVLQYYDPKTGNSR